jgi:hypothetical protein
VLYQSQILKRLNCVALFYIIEFAKWKLEISEISEYYSDALDTITNAYFAHRNILKKYYFRNLNCMSFIHVDPLIFIPEPLELELPPPEPDTPEPVI